jgi:putative toxin-antitoxin system antitoxin component (TIGR02293 family)
MDALTYKTIDYLGRENLSRDLGGVDARHIYMLLTEGLKSNAVQHTIAKSGFFKNQVAKILGKSPRWIERLQGDKTLPSDSAEKLIRFSVILAEGEEIFGDKTKFKKWLEQPIAALEGKTPMEFMLSGTYSGFEVVKKLLSMIKFGDFIS